MRHPLTIHTLTILLIGCLCLSRATAALAAPGDLDTTFTGTGISRPGFSTGADEANGAAAQPDGKLVVIGSTVSGYSHDFLVLRYNAYGSLDASFDGDGKAITLVGSGDDVAKVVAVQADGKTVVAGHASVTGANTDFSLFAITRTARSTLPSTSAEKRSLRFLSLLMRKRK